MSQLEAWQMVLVKESFLSSQHGQFGCIACHNGNPDTNDKENAHVSLISAPSDSIDKICGGCHGTIMENHRNSLHANLKGYFTLVAKRSGRDISQDPQIRPEFDKECGKCHASCGQCHVSRPVSARGGFINGHNFERQPDSKQNCTACHGSRVGAEYFGENEGMKADVHWIPNVKNCAFCHSDNAMHSSSTNATHRYEDEDMIRCEDCHEAAKEANQYHTTHWQSLSCQVCHSQPYKNCNGCHTGGQGITGSSYLTFKIAKNTRESENRPYKIVPVRHIPIARDTFSSWGIADLVNYDSEPTWKYATPHNIQRWTPQTTVENGWCGQNCHNSEYYLTLDDLDPQEIEANKNIVLEK